MSGLIKKFRSKVLRRFVKSDTGATAVEFALVAGPFLFVLCTICETGVMLFTEYAIQSGVQEATRQLRTGQAQAASMSAASFKSKICELAGIVIDCEADVTVYVRPATSFSSLKSNLPSFLNVGLKPDGSPNPGSYGCGGPSMPVGVIATYDWEFNVPFMSFMGNIQGGKARRLHGIAIARNEPFPAGAGTC
jgi:TadE-like protein